MDIIEELLSKSDLMKPIIGLSLEIIRCESKIVKLSNDNLLIKIECLQ